VVFAAGAGAGAGAGAAVVELVEECLEVEVVDELEELRLALKEESLRRRENLVDFDSLGF